MLLLNRRITIKNKNVLGEPFWVDFSMFSQYLYECFWLTRESKWP